MKKVNKDSMNRQEKIMYYLLSATILVDFINGIFSEFHIGEIYRIGVLIISTWIIFRVNIRVLGYILFVCLYIITNSLISFMDTANNTGLFYDLKMAMKAIYFIVIFLVLRSLYKVNKLKLDTVKKIILNNLYYTPLLFLLSYILGIGKTSYEFAGIGFKGTFMSLNSINISMIVLYIFALERLFRDRNKLKWFLVSVSLVICMILLGTKSSFIFIIFVPLLYFVININFKVRFKLSTFIFYYWMFLLSFLIMLFVIFNKPQISNAYFEQLIARQRYLFENRDLVTYLLSGRNWHLETASYYFMSEVSIFKILLGMGYFDIHNKIAVAWNYFRDVRPIELDIFDIFFSYGFVGVLLTYGYFLFHLFRSIKNVINKIAQPYFVSLVTLFIFSITGGHVFLEAISSTFLGISLAGWYIADKEVNKQLDKTAQ
jgi:O-antigen ligase like membrane protein